MTIYKITEKVYIHSLRKRGEVVELVRTPNTYVVEYTIKNDSGKTQKIRETFKSDEISLYKPKAKKPERKSINLWSKVKEDAKIPTKRKEDAGRDIYACFEGDEFTLHKLQPNKVPTGIASSISPKYYFNVKHERGSTGKYAMLLLSGCIDSGYRGEWFINICPLYKDVVISKTYEFPIEDGKKKPVELDDKIMYPYELAIAQAVKLEVPDDEDKEIPYDKLLKIKSERGIGAEGSSGK